MLQLITSIKLFNEFLLFSAKTQIPDSSPNHDCRLDHFIVPDALSISIYCSNTRAIVHGFGNILFYQHTVSLRIIKEQNSIEY